MNLKTKIVLLDKSSGVHGNDKEQSKWDEMYREKKKGG